MTGAAKASPAENAIPNCAAERPRADHRESRPRGNRLERGRQSAEQGMMTLEPEE